MASTAVLSWAGKGSLKRHEYPLFAVAAPFPAAKEHGPDLPT